MADGGADGADGAGAANPAEAGASGNPATPPPPPTQEPRAPEPPVPEPRVPDSSTPVLPAPEKSAPDLAFVLASGIALVAALVLVRNLLPAKVDLAETLRREEDLHREIEDLQAERLLLEKRAKALHDDDAYKERVLRGQTGMTKPGEFIVR